MSQDWRLKLRKGSIVDIKETCGLWSRAIIVEMNTIPTRSANDNSITNVRITISYLHKSSRYDEKIWILDKFIAMENTRVYNNLDIFPKFSKITVWDPKKGWIDGHIYKEKEKTILVNTSKYSNSTLNLLEYKKKSPCIQPFNFRNIITNDNYDKLMDEIILYIKNEKKENALRKKKSKQCKILDEYTVKMKKRKKMNCSCFLPRVCNKKCIAFRQGWINEFGYPYSWNDSSSINIFDCKDIRNFICPFLNLKSLLSIGCLCKKTCISIFNPDFLNLHVKNIKEFNKKYSYLCDISQQSLDVRTIPEVCPEQKKTLRQLMRKIHTIYRNGVILNPITVSVSEYKDKWNALETYMESLKKYKNYYVASQERFNMLSTQKQMNSYKIFYIESHYLQHLN